MMSLRTSAFRTASRVTFQQSRLLSSQGTDAVEKLRSVLEEYRRANYAQELPTRFKKDIFRAAALENPEIIPRSGLERVLANIGASERLSSSEINVIFEELGNENREIPVQQMSSLI